MIWKIFLINIILLFSFAQIDSLIFNNKIEKYAGKTQGIIFYGIALWVFITIISIPVFTVYFIWNI